MQFQHSHSIYTSAKTVVSFTATHLDYRGSTRNIDRRVFLEAKLNENGKCDVVFMTKMFDENAVVCEYDLHELEAIANDIHQYLSIAKLPD